MSSTVPTFKQKAHELIDRLPDAAEWKDLAYEASVLQDIQDGVRDSDAARVVSNEEVRNRFGLKG